MKNSENFIAPTSEKKAPRAGSKAHLESLKPRLNEILDWEKKIKEAKGQEEQALRKAFKDEFGATFNVKFMEKLTGESRSLETKEQPEEIVKMKEIKMNEMVAADMEAEEAEAASKGVSADPEFNKEAGKIDDERQVVVQESVSKAKEVINGEGPGIEENNKIEKVNTELLINQVGSFEDLLTVIKDNNLLIQGSSELFTSEMLQDVIVKIKSREFPLNAATSKDGFRAKVAELLQSDSNIDDLKKLLEDVKSKLSSESHVIGASTSHPLNERRDQRLRWKERLEQAIYQIEENNKNTQEALKETGQLEKEIKDNNAADIKVDSKGFKASGDPEEKYALMNEILTTQEEVTEKMKGDEVVDIEVAKAEEREKLEELREDELQIPVANNQEKIVDQEAAPEVEKEKYSTQVLESFKQLSLSPEDLETIPGLIDLPETAQMMIAKSLQTMAFEGAKNKVGQEESKKMQDKSFLGRIGQGIVNSFKSKDAHRQALIEQKEGGLEKHGANLVNMVDWAKTFIPSESINEKGEKQIDFMSLPPNFELNNEEKKVFDDFNKVAMTLASLPKHDLAKFDSLAKNSPEYEKAEYYKTLQTIYDRKKDLIKDILITRGGDNEKTVDIKFHKADARLNMLQFLSADPNLEKEWSNMLKKEPWYKNIYKTGSKYISSNTKFLASGFVARPIVSMTFASTFGVAAGVVAIPLVAATIGAWRGKERANKKLKEQDKFVDKKTLYEHPVLTERKKALNDLQSLLPLYSDLEGEEFKNRPGRMSYEKWSKTASPQDLEKYQKAKAKFDQLDLKWQRTENKNVEKKTLKADDLTEKLQELINKARNVDNIEARDATAGALKRRLDFSKRLADDGLVNFGSIEERTKKMGDFYKTIGIAQLVLFNFDYENLELNYERGLNNKVPSPEMVKVQERAEDLINYLEHQAGKKLDRKRKDFVVSSMIKGAVMGATFASVGSAAYQGISGLMHNSAEGLVAGAVASTTDEAVSNTDALASSAGEEILNTSAETSVIDKVDIPAESPSSIPETVPEEPILSTTVDLEEQFIPAVENEQSSWSDIVSNEGLKPGQHDSVWRSTKEIFLNNAKALGYDGDEIGLAKWAEIQTNKALANSGEIADKVFEGNKVILERVDDTFAVVAEQGEGLEPGQLPEAMDRVEPLSEMSPRLGTEIIEGASSGASEDASAEVTGNIINSASSLEASPTAINKWLATVGEKFSLAASEMSYVGDNIIKTVIGGQEIFIDPIKDQFYFFNDTGEELSGFLANDQGEVVNDVKAFLAEKFDLTSIDTLEEEVGEGVNQFINPSEGSWSGQDMAEGVETAGAWSSEDIGGGAEAGDDMGQSLEEVVDSGRNWDDLSSSEKINQIREFFQTTEGSVIKAKANDVGILMDTNSHLPMEELSKEALNRFSEFTGIEDLAKNITDEESKELSKLIGFIGKNGYNSQVHGQKLANFAAKLMFSRGI